MHWLCFMCAFLHMRLALLEMACDRPLILGAIDPATVDWTLVVIWFGAGFVALRRHA